MPPWLRGDTLEGRITNECDGAMLDHLCSARKKFLNSLNHLVDVYLVSR